MNSANVVHEGVEKELQSLRRKEVSACVEY
jgi:hypothetical protein